MSADFSSCTVRALQAENQRIAPAAIPGQREEREMKKITPCAVALIVLATVFVTNAKAEDPIADWNAIAEKAIKTAGHPLPVTSVEFAIVQLAIYDAVESIDRRYEPYHALVPGATGSLSAAAAKAGHDVLVGLFGETASIDADYTTFLTTNGIDPNDPGVTVGAQAAAAILSLRSHDGRSPLTLRRFLAATRSASGDPRRPFCQERHLHWHQDLLPGLATSRHSQ